MVPPLLWVCTVSAGSPQGDNRALTTPWTAEGDLGTCSLQKSHGNGSCGTGRRFQGPPSPLEQQELYHPSWPWKPG